MKYNQIVLGIILMVVIVINAISLIEYNNNRKQIFEIRKQNYNYCMKENNELCRKIIEERKEYEKCNGKNDERCKLIVNNFKGIKSNVDTFSEMKDTTTMTTAPIIMFLVIIYCTFITTYNFKSLTIKNYLNRIPYNEYVKKIYKYNLLGILIPIVFNILLVISVLITTKSLELSFVLNKNSLLLYFVNPILQSIFIVNISFILSLNSKNEIVSFAKASVLYFVIIFVVGGIDKLFKKINIEQINMFDMLNYSGTNITTIIFTLGTNILLIVCSMIVLCLIFKNKERCIILMEGENV